MTILRAVLHKVSFLETNFTDNSIRLVQKVSVANFKKGGCVQQLFVFRLNKISIAIAGFHRLLAPFGF